MQVAGLIRRTGFSAIGLSLSAFWVPISAGQCPTGWLPGEGIPGVTGDLPVWALTTWDPDGAGSQPPLLIAGGGFHGAGDVQTFGIAAWDGSDWSTVGGVGALGIPGANDQVMALTVFNGDLIAAGFFTNIGGVPANRIARWDGEQWHPLGSGLNIHSVRALAVYNGELYVGGFFDQAGGIPAKAIAKWNGSTWSGVGGGVNLPPTSGVPAVFALTVYDGKLIVGGGFTTAGGVTVRHVASWNGSSWAAMNAPPGEQISVVESLTVYQGQLVAGANLFVNGGFHRSVSRWNPSTNLWGPLGTGVNDSPNDAVFAMIQYNGDLYAGGVFTNAGGVSTPFRMARWNGVSWSSVTPGPGIPGRRVYSFALHNGDLIAGGLTSQASGLQASATGRFDGTYWYYMGGGFDFIIYDFETYNGELIAGGPFYQAGDIVANGIARRDNNGQWHSMGGVSGGDGFVYDLIVYDGTLIASGPFTMVDGIPAPNGVAQWDGQSWSAFGNAPVSKKLVHNGDLYAVGIFGDNQQVARWNPAAKAWDPIGTFLPNTGISCITFFEGDLIAGGIGVNASVWRWDFDNPTTWQPIGQHLGYAMLQTLAVYNGELLAGGYVGNGVMRFNGTSWVTLGNGMYLGNDMPDEVLAIFDLRIFNGDLIVAGTFSYAGGQQYSQEGVEAYHVARWNGTNWFALGGGTNNAVVTLHQHQNKLVVGGWFTLADGGASGGKPNGYWAQFGPICPGDIDGDGFVNVNDLLAVIAAWGPCAPPCPPNCPADVTNDCAVNVNDLLLVIGNWG